MINLDAKIGILLNDAIESFKPDTIVTVERKGTALLRAAIENGDIDWTWSKVLSSSAISGLQSDYLVDQRVLVFDDSVNHGHKMQETVESISRKFNDEVKIATVAFAVHENCQANILPDFFFFVALKDKKYKEIRRAVNDYLQEKGSLLLDTEHIEILVDLKGREEKFYNTISVLGRTVKFESINTLNKNVTLYHPLGEHFLQLAKELLPEGTNISDGVWKCRFVNRPHNKIAIIPICYPIIPSTFSAEYIDSLPTCIKELVSDEEEHFKLNYHLIGIYASLKMLSGIFSVFSENDARSLIGMKYPEIYDNEKHNNLSREERGLIITKDTYSHLLALFPKMDIVALKNLVCSEIQKGLQDRALNRKLSKNNDVKVTQLEPEKLIVHTRRLSKIIFDIMQYNKSVGFKSNGACTDELVKWLKQDSMAQKVPIEIFSTAMDQLIDEAVVNTDIDKITFNDDSERVFRTFRPDGEFVTSEILRNYYDL